MPNAEIELTQDLVEALEPLLESGLTTVGPAVVLAGYLDALAKSYGLSESVKISEDPLERVDPPSPALVTLRHYLAGGGELSDASLRTELYKVFVELSSDASVRRELNRNKPLSEQGLLYLAQIYWNLEGTSDRPALPIRPGKIATGGARIDADIPAPGGNKDYAVMLWTARVMEKGPYKSSGQSFRKQGARLAVLAAKRLASARTAPPSSTPSEGILRRSETGGRRPKAITWATDGGSSSDGLPGPMTTGRSGMDLLITSTARARFAVDSLEQDLRYAIERFVPDELSPEDIFGSMYAKLLARRASADAPDTEAMTAYLHPQESRDILLHHADALPPELGQVLESTVTALDAFVPVRNRIVRGRPLQPEDLDQVGAFIERFQSAHFPLTTAALGQLASDSGWQPKPRAGSGPLDLVLHNLPTADFDETGLLGREQLVNEIVAMVKRRRYPIMLRGEGGIGKTALALEVAYRFIDDPESPFDAVLWTSLKTEQLTTAGVQDLSNALRDVAGVAAVVGTAVDETFRGGIEELGAVIGEMRTLIVVDNLETLHGDEFFALDDALSDRDVTFLLTSRVGTGDRTQTRDVGPLDEASATQLFRNFARSNGSYDLAE